VLGELTRLTRERPSFSDEEERGWQAMEVLWTGADEGAPRAQGLSFVNPRHPDSNEDRFLCLPEVGLAAVFDGLGGEAGGEDASRAACGTMALCLGDLPPEGDEEQLAAWLARSFLLGSQAIWVSRWLHRSASGQGTTACAVLLAPGRALAVSGGQALVACVGDSRAYRWRDGILEDLTKRELHWPEGQRVADLLDEVQDESELDDDRDLRRAFYSRNIMDTELGALRAEPEVLRCECQDGDILIACTDGVHDNLTNTEICSIASEHAAEGPEAVAQALAKAARDRAEEGRLRSKRDDITVACLLVGA
jgi:protein phosphatase